MIESLRGKSKSRCKKHPGKDVEINCIKCSMAVCTLRYIADHNGHECSEIDTLGQLHLNIDGGELIYLFKIALRIVYYELSNQQVS